MIKAIVPLALALSFGAAVACPDGDKAMQAKAAPDAERQAATTGKAVQAKADVAKKAVKTAEVKKPTT